MLAHSWRSKDTAENEGELTFILTLPPHLRHPGRVQSRSREPCTFSGSNTSSKRMSQTPCDLRKTCVSSKKCTGYISSVGTVGMQTCSSAPRKKRLKKGIVDVAVAF